MGLRFNSPTINLWFKPKDYIKFLKNLKYYLYECKMQQDVDESQKYKYPVGILDDIRIYFQHYESYESAKEKWYKRVKRINFDNLYIVMVQRDGCTEAEIEEFDELKYKHKIIFTVKNYPEYKSAYYIQNSEKDMTEVKNLCDYQGKFTGKRIFDEFDWIQFLNKR